MESLIGATCRYGKIVSIIEPKFFEKMFEKKNPIMLTEFDIITPNWTEKPVLCIEEGLSEFRKEQVSSFFGIPKELVTEKLADELYRTVTGYMYMPYDYAFPAEEVEVEDGTSTTGDN